MREREREKGRVDKRKDKKYVTLMEKRDRWVDEKWWKRMSIPRRDRINR